MMQRLGCVLAIRNRPTEVLEHTLQTYAYQTVQAVDKVLLDYGSEPKLSEAYRHLCQRFGWRFVAFLPDVPGWSLSAAYNRAVGALDREVEVVFKSDIDVLLGCNVLETAAVLGRDKLCIFSCLTTVEGATYPSRLACHGDFVQLLRTSPPVEKMLGEGLHAYPKRWLEEIGGYDLQFTAWGYEDSDLRERAKRSIGILLDTTALLIHQWHPRAQQSEVVARNRAYYDRMKRQGEVVRNGGVLCPAGQGKVVSVETPAAASKGQGSRGEKRRTRLAFATRSMNEFLYHASGELLGLDRLDVDCEFECTRHRLTGTDSFGYFKQFLDLDADWVVNLDEDAFVLYPKLLFDLVRRMGQDGYAACGMPDGGVVRIRHHNPIACNAFFNVFDMRRVRPVWTDWQCVTASGHKAEYETRVANFAGRRPFAFDHFERYYGAFFSLLAAGERILYLDAEEWSDGVSTLLKDDKGDPFLLHCWYTRNWETSHHTRQRYRAAVDYARQVQGLAPTPEGWSRPKDLTAGVESGNQGKWAALYQGLKNPYPYGDVLTYEKAAHFLGSLQTVEDWGCGCAWFKRYLLDSVRYKGVDGSHSPFADEIADLTHYSSQAEGILLRHVLEHNPAWEAILANALRSFTKRLVLVLFTPFAETTSIIAYNEGLGVPDIAFAKVDLVRHFRGLKWHSEENLATKTQYGVEHVFYLEKS